jgi:hypothetical protein
MKITITTWDDISMDVATHKAIEVECASERAEDIAHAVNLALERNLQEDPTLEATEYELVKVANGNQLNSGVAWFVDDRDHESVLIWREK